jgi:CHAT domain-containing protein
LLDEYRCSYVSVGRGDLTRLPFEALPLAAGRRLLDEYRSSYVSVGRDVLRFQVRSGRPPGEPLVAADPDFDLAVGTAAPRPEQPQDERDPWEVTCDLVLERRQAEPASRRPTPAALPSSRQSRDLDRSRYHFGRLPGTRAEAERIAALVGVQAWTEKHALEGRLKRNCHSPRIVHPATHGFFLPDQQVDLRQLGRNLELLGVAGPAELDKLSGPGMENPMLRSGLALAGANTFLRGGSLPEEAEDGLLTAEDVAGLDLLDTELVVLSACDTGLGEVHAGEGVFGLRRAFIVAGAKTLVMSLWKVPDQQTQELMTDFYSRLLAGRGVADALREAQLALRAKHPEPFYWGAFICQGDPAALGAS